MKFVHILFTAFCALAAAPSSAAVIEFEFSGIFDAPNDFAPVGTAFSGKFGYDSSLTAAMSYIDAANQMSYALYEDPSIFIEATFGGVTYRSAASAAISNLEIDGFGFGVWAYGPDKSISINYEESMIFDLNRLQLPTSFGTLGVRPDPLNDWEGQHAPSSEFDFYDVGTGKNLNAAVSKIGLVGSSAPMGSAVPEPSNWAMMIAGFGMAGAALRRRREVTRVSFA